MTTIPSRWPAEGYCRLVFPRSCDMTWHCLDNHVSSRNVFSVFYLSFSYNQAQLSPIVPKYFSRRILSSFRKVLIGNTIVTCLESIHRANKCTFSNWCLFHFLVPPRIRCNVCFIVNTCSSNKGKLKYSTKSGFLDRIIKRSSGKKPSEPSR